MLLAIDTSQMTYSLCLGSDYIEWNDINITLLDQLQSKPIKDIEGVLINTGPGRFSGLRSGLAFAKGFALAKQIPLIPINRFELIASMVSDEAFSIALDARKDQAFLQSYPNPQDIQLISQASLKDITNLYGNIEPAQIINTNAKNMVDYYKTHKPKALPAKDIHPLYVRESV